jgi:hypothetical protein
VAEEILKSLGQRNGFSKERFYRGIVLPPGGTNEEGRLGDGGHFPGNVVIERGVLQKDKSILDLADCLREGDVILKGANSLDPEKKQAAVLIGYPRGGTTLTILQAVVGRRMRLILPVGLEKRIPGDLMELDSRLNGLVRCGFRLLPVRERSSPRSRPFGCSQPRRGGACHRRGGWAERRESV